VRTTAAVRFGTEALTLDLAPDARADRVALVARDAQGRVVSREDVGRGAGEIDWFGRDAGGAKLPDGSYTFTLEQYQGETRLPDGKVGAYARVLEARIGPAGPQLVLEGGSAVAADSVTALRDPG
jgi:flagellar basal-body rod modification protein FlgD